MLDEKEKCALIPCLPRYAVTIATLLRQSDEKPASPKTFHLVRSLTVHRRFEILGP